MSAVVFPQAGGCLCGTTRYALEADPLFAYACHCRDCQTATGSVYALCLATPLVHLSITSGESARRRFPFADGREWNLAVCPECETWLWSLRRATPEVVSLKAGTLDDASWVKPVGHIWTESAIDLGAISAESIVFPRAPGDPGEMMRAWRERDRAPA